MHLRKKMNDAAKDSCEWLPVAQRQLKSTALVVVVPSLEINRLDKVSGLRKPANSFSYCEFSIAVLARFR
jgi:hypothetical protein